MKLKIDIKVINAQQSNIATQCERIADENHVKNNGTLRFLELYKESDYILYCQHNNQIIGYAYLSNHFISNDDLYIEQIAIKKEYHNMGIGTKIIKYLKSHSKQYNRITSNVKEDNLTSLNFHKKNGFKIIGNNEYGLTLSLKIKKLFNKKLKI